MYECLHSYTPFSECGQVQDDWAIIRSITDAELNVEYDSAVAPPARALMESLLDPDPGSRADAGSVRAHSFFADGVFNFGELLAKSVKPPYVPSVKDPFDVGNFDPDIEEHLTGKNLLGIEAEPYPEIPEWDADF